MKYFAAWAALTLFALPAAAQSPEEIAEAALEAAPVWDGHNDVPIQLRVRLGNSIGDFDFTDTADVQIGPDTYQAMHTDLTRLRKGRVGAQFWSVYVNATLPEPQAVAMTLEQIDVTKRLVAKYPEDLSLALGTDDVQRAMSEGKIASLMGMEGGHSIGSSLAILRQMYDLGVRYMTLTHSKNTSWADSATDAPQHKGLTDFGEDIVREMNRLGMIVDLSHVSEDVMLDALEVAKAPVIFSHSGARSITGHPRNVPDEVLIRLNDNGGIVMVVALPYYVSEAVRQWRGRYKAEEARLAELHPGEPQKAVDGLAAWKSANPEPATTVSDMADHIDHIRRIAGIDHIGIGGDYDGMPTGPLGMEDVSGYPKLFAELARRGYSQADLEKIASRNMMRVLREVERVKAELASETPLERASG